MGTFDNRTTMYVSSSKYTAVAQWAATTAYVKGNLVRQLAAPSNGNERVFMCYAAGTSGASEPTWTFTTGDLKTGDGTVSWVDVTGAAAVNGDLANTPKWAAGGGGGRTPNTGQTITDAAGTHAFVCIVSGGTGGSEPSWNTTAVGNTTTDSSATWMYIGTAATLTKWGAPHARLKTATQSNYANNNGNGFTKQFFVGNNHAEICASGTGDINPSFGNNGENGGPALVACVNEAGNVPPQASDITTGASLTDQNSTMSFGGYFTMIGIACTVTQASQISPAGDGAGIKEYINCSFTFTSTNNNAFMQPASRTHGRVVYRNCSVVFAGTNQFLQAAGYVRWYGGSIGLTGSQNSGGGIIQSSDDCDWVFKGVDFSNCLASGNYEIVQFTAQDTLNVRFEDCKLPSIYTDTFWPHGMNIYGASSITQWIEFMRCGADWQYAKFNIQGWLIATNEFARASGASDGTTSYCWRAVMGIQSNGSSTYVDNQSGFYECPPIITYNANLGSPGPVVDVYGASFGTAMPTNGDIWLEVDYMGGAAGTDGTRLSGRVARLGTNTSLATDNSHWSGAAARQNSHAYNAGDFIADPAGNGRPYMCTTAGTSAASQPGGYASAVDGTNVTDGTAHFTAGWRFIVSLALVGPDPAQAGNIAITVCFGGPQSNMTTTHFLIDPQPAL